MTEHAVVIAGGGPTGLMQAGELALAGGDVAIVELGVPISRGRDVTGCAQDDTGVDVALSDSRSCGRATSQGATEDAA